MAIPTGGRNSFDQLQRMRVDFPLDAVAIGTHAVVSASLVPNAGTWRVRVLRVDASYSNAANGGLLTIMSGAVTIVQKFILGAGAIDFDLWGGRPSEQLGDTITASLADGGSGISGTVYIQGFQSYEN